MGPPVASSVDLPEGRFRPLAGKRFRKQPFEWNTREESNLHVLGSKPNRDAGTPRLGYRIRRQDSDLRELQTDQAFAFTRSLLMDAQLPHRSQRRLAAACEAICRRTIRSSSGEVIIIWSPRSIPATLRLIWIGVYMMPQGKPHQPKISVIAESKS